MFRIQRLIYYILILAVFVFISTTIIPHLKPKSPSIQNKPKKANPNEEKYLSWFPHSDFPEQQESFRNALRLALETKRTIIAPMLRINNIYPWLPFEDLAKRYEAQEKSTLKAACEQHVTNWQTQLEPCDTINDWIEVPWSSIMDLEPLKREYGIKIIERTQGHGWGIHESALGGNIHPDDVAIVDVMTYKENGTDWEYVDPAQEQHRGLSNWIQSFFKREPKLTSPLKFVLSVDKLHAIDAKIIQFGALNSAARYQTTQNAIQNDLRKAMMKTRFNVPDNFPPMKAQAQKVIDALGGKFQYSTLILNLSKIVAMDARAGLDGNEIVNGMDDLSDKAKKELMDAVVLEIFGDIPINQAVSAALPIKPSKLASLLTSPGSLDRRELLAACVDYHQNVEKRYPIYYLVNEMGVAPETRPDIFEPLLNMFPCIFSRHDMLRWGVQTDHWASNQISLTDKQVNYEKLFQPLLDILIAGKGYSFFEIPTTPLTRFLNWSPKD